MNFSGSVLGGRSGRFGRGFGLSSSSAAPVGGPFFFFWVWAPAGGIRARASRAAASNSTRAGRDSVIGGSVGRSGGAGMVRVADGAGKGPGGARSAGAGGVAGAERGPPDPGARAPLRGLRVAATRPREKS